MAEGAKWTSKPIEDGIAVYRLQSWTTFPEFLKSAIFTKRGRAPHRFIWRGHREQTWELMPSLDRLFFRLAYRQSPGESAEQRAAMHLEEFKYAARGRRRFTGEMTENEWWALGQHFGLATPLLDWTHSPYVATYFAFEEPTAESDLRVVFALDRDAVQLKNRSIVEDLGTSKDTRPDILELIEPLSDENPRLVSQGAFFTRGPIGISVESWVAAFFEGSDAVLYRIEMPNTDRTECLRALNTMNINHLSLFPDLTGASRATNMRTELDLL